MTKIMLLMPITNEEIPTNFGRGGMKKLFEEFLASYPSQVANVTNITAKCGFGEIGGNHSVRLTTIDRNGVVSHQIVDADVAEKRRRGDTLGRNVRPRLDDGRTDNVPTVPQQSQPVSQPQLPQHCAASIPPDPPPNTPAPAPPPATDTSSTISQAQPMDVDPTHRSITLPRNFRNLLILTKLGRKQWTSKSV
jgi:hypothetical protein